MKNIQKKDQEKLEKILIAAYRGKEQVEAGELLETRVMDHIRNLEALSSQTNFFDLFEGFVWRFSPIAAVLIFLLIAAITQLDFVSDYEMARIFAEDPVDFGLSALVNS